MPDLEKDKSHPGLYELLEWVSGRSEVFEPARAKAHLDAGCKVCREEVAFLESLGELLRLESDYDAFFEGLEGTGADAWVESSARGLVLAMEEGVAEFREVLASADGTLAFRRALRHAAQLAAPLVTKDPAAMGEIAGLLSVWARRNADGALEGEGELLSSQALAQLGRNREARAAVVRARGAFGRGLDEFRAALCDYYEGSAASFEGDYLAAEELLGRARRVFAEYGQRSWEGRAVAALATAIAQRGDDAAAMPLYDQALGALDVTLDGPQWVQTLINKASSLVHMGSFADARRLYARALSHTLRRGAARQTHMIRLGLADIEFRRGDYAQALGSWRKLADVAARAGWDDDALYARLYEAEILGRLGRDAEMRRAVERLRGERGGGSEPALEDLFSCLDAGELEAGAVAHVREYLDRPANVVYVPFQRAQAGA